MPMTQTEVLDVCLKITKHRFFLRIKYESAYTDSEDELSPFL